MKTTRGTLKECDGYQGLGLLGDVNLKHFLAPITQKVREDSQPNASVLTFYAIGSETYYSFGGLINSLHLQGKLHRLQPGAETT